MIILALNFKETEQELLTLIENNPKDEKIYTLIRDIAFNYLFNVMRPGSSYYDYDIIASDLAADLFLRIIKGAKIEHFTNYISHILKAYYLKLYEDINWSVVIDTTLNNDLEQSIKTSCMSSRNDDHDKIENILTGIYFSQFESIITDVMKSTKFKYNTKERLNLEISILLTLNKGKEIYFRIGDELKPYIKFIITQIKQRMTIDGICGRETYSVYNLNNDGSYLDDL